MLTESIPSALGVRLWIVCYKSATFFTEVEKMTNYIIKKKLRCNIEFYSVIKPKVVSFKLLCLLDRCCCTVQQCLLLAFVPWRQQSLSLACRPTAACQWQFTQWPREKDGRLKDTHPAPDPNTLTLTTHVSTDETHRASLRALLIYQLPRVKKWNQFFDSVILTLLELESLT